MQDQDNFLVCNLSYYFC